MDNAKPQYTYVHYLYMQCKSSLRRGSLIPSLVYFSGTPHLDLIPIFLSKMDMAQETHSVLLQQHPPQGSDSENQDSTSSTSTITDLMEDASSSSSDSTNSSLNGPLYELSELVAHLPIKRGLSRHYEGKSQSFKSLTSVMGLEDLAKKEDPYNKRMKLCRRYGGRLHGHGQRFCTPKPTIAKKSSSSRSSYLTTMAGRNDLLSACNRSPIINHLQK